MTITRRFLLEELNCQVSIGIYDAERQAKQTVLIDAELLLRDGTEPKNDSVDTTIDYDVIRDTIHGLAGRCIMIFKKRSHGAFLMLCWRYRRLRVCGFVPANPRHMMIVSRSPMS